MTCTAGNICTCAVFATTSFNFQPILFHTIVMDGHYMLFSIEEFFFLKKIEVIEQSCLTVVCQMTCQRSHIRWCASC